MKMRWRRWSIPVRTDEGSVWAAQMMAVRSQWPLHSSRVYPGLSQRQILQINNSVGVCFTWTAFYNNDVSRFGWDNTMTVVMNTINWNNKCHTYDQPVLHSITLYLVLVTHNLQWGPSLIFVMSQRLNSNNDDSFPFMNLI